jgi:predicted tellurium resistance membrane protein TerC
MLMRIALLFSLSWILRLTAPLLTVWQQAVSGRDLILLLGGLFLLAKSTYEIGLWQRFMQYPHITTGLASRTRAQVEAACAAD